MKVSTVERCWINSAGFEQIYLQLSPVEINSGWLSDVKQESAYLVLSYWYLLVSQLLRTNLNYKIMWKILGARQRFQRGTQQAKTCSKAIFEL